MKENLTGTTWHWQRTLMNDDTSFAPDDPSRAIVAFAKRDGTDLIVMGSRVHGDIEGVLLGGVSHKVSSLAKCT